MNYTAEERRVIAELVRLKRLEEDKASEQAVRDYWEDVDRRRKLGLVCAYRICDNELVQNKNRTKKYCCHEHCTNESKARKRDEEYRRRLANGGKLRSDAMKFRVRPQLRVET